MEKERQIALITAVQNGDSAAADEFFGEIYNDVYYFALKTVKDETLACDITQETLIEVFKKIGELRDPAAFPAWCRQIAFFQCTRYFRKKKDVILDEDEEGASIFDNIKEESAEFIPDEALDRKDFQKTILAFIDTLSEEQRSAVMMFYFDELSVSQIAEIQGVSEGTVKSRLNYARKAIKAQVEEYEKKNNTKLRAFAFFPFFSWLFSSDFLSAKVPAGAFESAKAATLGGSAAATATAATATAATTAATAAASGIGVKIAAGIVAAAVAVAGVCAIPGTVTKNGEKMSIIGAIFSSDSHMVIPEGGVYETTDPETGEELVLEGDGKTRFPEEPREGDVYTYQSYAYEYSNERLHLFGGDYCDCLGWNAYTVDKEQTSYEPIVAKIGNIPVTGMARTYGDCDNLIVAPEIPSGVTCVASAFLDCDSLTTAPKIPNGVIDMNSTFQDCDSLDPSTIHIPESVMLMDSTFARSFLSGGNSALHGGTFRIDANPAVYDDCFFQIRKVTVTGKTKLKAELEGTGSGSMSLY